MKTALCVLTALACAAPAFAQQQPAGPVDLATQLKRQHAGIRRNLAASAEKMAEADYAFKPQGVGPEVRTFGQLLVHLVNANNSFCRRAKGDAAQPPLDEKATMTKAEIVKHLNEALTYCDAVYDAQTSATLAETVKMQGRGGAVEVARGGGLISNLAHNNEHYGNLVTYMRAKGLVPPSSEGR